MTDHLSLQEIYTNVLCTFCTDLHRDIASTLPTGVGVRGYEDANDIIPQNRPRTQTRERRSQTITFIPQMGPEYKFIEKYNIVSVAGRLLRDPVLLRRFWLSLLSPNLSLTPLSPSLPPSFSPSSPLSLSLSLSPLSFPLLKCWLSFALSLLCCHVGYVCCSLVNICAMFHTNSAIHCSRLPRCVNTCGYVAFENGFS